MVWEEKMADIIELGLFLYSLIGSASIGYWVLTSFWPQIRERENSFKTGLSVVIGAAYILFVFVLASFLGASHYNGWSFVQAFFWLVPVSFIVLASILLFKQGIVLARQVQSGEVKLFAPIIEPAAETTPLSGSAKMISELAEPFPEKNEEKNDSTSKTTSQEVLPKTDSEISNSISSVEPKGEAEEDVAAEIKRIMSQGRFQSDAPLAPLPTPEQKTKAPIQSTNFEIPADKKFDFNPPSNPAQKTGLSQEEIDKIKQELKKKIQESENL